MDMARYFYTIQAMVGVMSEAGLPEPSFCSVVILERLWPPLPMGSVGPNSLQNCLRLLRAGMRGRSNMLTRLRGQTRRQSKGERRRGQGRIGFARRRKHRTAGNEQVRRAGHATIRRAHHKPGARSLPAVFLNAG